MKMMIKSRSPPCVSTSLSVLCSLIVSVIHGTIGVETVTFCDQQMQVPDMARNSIKRRPSPGCRRGVLPRAGLDQEGASGTLLEGKDLGSDMCNFTSKIASSPACETGDCDGKLACNGSIGLPPATLVQFSLEPDRSKPSFYDVSLVDGYNVPISVSPTKAREQLGVSGSGCTTIEGCSTSLTAGSIALAACPQELQVVNSHGDEVVACKSTCLAFNLDVFCCRNEYGTPEKCKPTLYSKVFKDACPSYFSYAFDDPLPLHSCRSNEYAITFCPPVQSERGVYIIRYEPIYV